MANSITLSNFKCRSYANADPIAATVLATFHQLHQSFFKFKTFPSVSASLNDGNSMRLFDPGEPALFFDLSLFGGLPITHVLTSNVNLRALRGDYIQANNKTYAYDGTPTSTISWPSSGPSAAFSFAPWGQIVGIQMTDSMKVDLVRAVNSSGTPTATEAVELLKTFGGGVLGTRSYQYLAVEPEGFRSTVFKMHRTFAQAVFSDFLCRELPVVRTQAAETFVVNPGTPGTLSFRAEKNCVTCHASMDRLAAVNRNFLYTQAGRFQVPGASGFIMPDHLPTSRLPSATPLPASTPVWPSQEDVEYYRRPPQGTLFYTDSDGVTISRDVNGLPELGTALSNQTDFYRCVVKKYYQYFTGVQVDILDPEDGRYRNKGPQMQIHFKNVKDLAAKLQQDKNLKNLIINILNSPVYKESNLGI